jgi:aminoglycoside phosphotransferase (APT) family kinase protein
MTAIERAAAHLGLRVVRPFGGGMFGAVLVERPDGHPLVLKASHDVELVDEWITGASMAELLRREGYPAATYVDVGTDAGVAWTLQEVLSGVVPEVLTESLAHQLVALARRHDRDAGHRRPWDELARRAASGWLDELRPSLPDDFGAVLAEALADTASVTVAQTTVVHGDFHHRNLTVVDGRVTGIFDWDIAGAGDWRVDLVNLAFACTMYPQTCDAAALDVVVGEVRSTCDRRTASFFLTCLVLRALWLLAARQPQRLVRGSRTIQRSMADWW